MTKAKLVLKAGSADQIRVLLEEEISVISGARSLTAEATALAEKSNDAGKFSRNN